MLKIILLIVLSLTACATEDQELKEIKSHHTACQESLLEKKPIKACKENSSLIVNYLSDNDELNETSYQELAEVMSDYQYIYFFTDDFQSKMLAHDSFMKVSSAIEQRLDAERFKYNSHFNNADKAIALVASFYDDSQLEYISSFDSHDIIVHQFSDEASIYYYFFEGEEEEEEKIDKIIIANEEQINKMVFANQVKHQLALIYQNYYLTDIYENEKLAHAVYRHILQGENATIEGFSPQTTVKDNLIIIETSK